MTKNAESVDSSSIVLVIQTAFRACAEYCFQPKKPEKQPPRGEWVIFLLIGTFQLHQSHPFHKMKIGFVCDECWERLSNGESTPIYILTVENNGVYTLTCNEGHKTHHVIVNQSLKYFSESRAMLFMTAIIERPFRHLLLG